MNSLFGELSSPEKREEGSCCPMQLKTGVQIIAGVLAIISSVILVIICYAIKGSFLSQQTITIFFRIDINSCTLMRQSQQHNHRICAAYFNIPIF